MQEMSVTTINAELEKFLDEHEVEDEEDPELMFHISRMIRSSSSRSIQSHNFSSIELSL